MGLSTSQAKPSLYQGHAVPEVKAHPVGSLYNNLHVALENSDQNWDVLICDLWKRGMDSIHDMRVVSTDYLSHRNKSPDKCLHTSEKDKNKKYVDSVLQQRLHLYSFVVSMGWLLGVEAKVTLKHISIRLASKWKQPYSWMCVYIKSRIYITLVRASHRCIRGSQVLAHIISAQLPQWEHWDRLHFFL